MVDEMGVRRHVAIGHAGMVGHHTIGLVGATAFVMEGRVGRGGWT